MTNYKNLFPELENNPKISYFDWCASSLKPREIIENVSKFLETSYAPIGRGNYPIAISASKKIEEIRKSVKDFIKAKNANQIVFTSGTTLGLNEVAIMLREKLTPDSIVVVSDLDHHSLRLVWENFANLGLCKIWVCPIKENGTLDLTALENKIKKDNVKIACITAMSNTMGTRQDLKKLSKILKNTISIIDLAQWVAHEETDVMDFDFACFSGHKIYADSGIGVMYIREPEKYSPAFFGGGMVQSITKENKIIYFDSPSKFEAGTLATTQIISLGSAIDFIKKLGFKKIKKHEEELAKKLIKELKKIKGIKFLNPKIKDEPVITFNIDKLSPLDLSTFLGMGGVCTRAGNHCASWIHKKLKINSSLRFSLGLGINEEDITKAITELNSAIKKLK